MTIIEAEKLNLKDNHLYFSFLGSLYTKIDNSKAVENYEKALSLATTLADKATIQNKLKQA